MALDIEAVRREFPYLDSCIYLNTATAGVSWRGQGAAAARFYDEDKARGFAGHQRWSEEMAAAQRMVAQLLRVSPEEVSFAASTSEALNLVAPAVPLAAGDRVVFLDDEFPSVVLSWATRPAAGVEIVRVPVPEESERTDALIAAISDRTRVVCVSHVHWCTGTRVDLGRLAAACRANGARLIVDGVQAVGAIDVDASVTDLYAASVFKWLLSGFGLAIVVTRLPFADTLEPAMRGYGNEPPSRGLRYSHANYPGIYALTAALRFLQTIGWPDIFERIAMLTGLLDRGLRDAGWQVVTPAAARAGIVSIAHPSAAQCAARLLERGVSVEERCGLLRISPHFYNREDEILRLIELLGPADARSLPAGP